MLGQSGAFGQRRVVVVVFALVALATIGSTASSLARQADGAADGEASLTRTDVRYFIPVNPGGLNVGLAVVGEEEGTCFAGSSAAATRSDAWRCGAENGILDPCFADPFQLPGELGTLYCASNPFAGDVVEFTLTQPLPEDGGNGSLSLGDEEQDGMLPWALELENGEQCSLMSGATVAIAGQRLNYACESGASVIGDVDRGQPRWVVNYLEENGYATRQMGVEVAWS